MKTPEEIKKGLMCGSVFCNIACPYWNDDSCTIKVNKDALALVQQLEAENAELKRERDAAIHDLKKTRECTTCEYVKKSPSELPCVSCGIILKNYEWRGPCDENGGGV